MCGIFAYIGDKRNAGDLVLEGLKSLEYRGYDSWGVAAKKTDGSLFIEKHTGKIGDAKLAPVATTIGIGHTRWATHGGVTDQNAHPHTDCSGDIVIVHNGIVENFKELKDNLIAQGHRFESQTDTEVLAHQLEEIMKTEQEPRAAMLKLFGSIRGMNAVIAFLPKQEMVLAIKNGSPIVLGKTETELILSSDAAALVPYTRDVYFVEDGELIEMIRGGVQVYDLNNNPQQLAFTTLQFTADDIKLGDFPHYMIKEIYEQPMILRHLAVNREHDIDALAEVIRKAYGTFFVGCGTASFACLAGTYLFSKIAKRHVNSCVASEFAYLEDFIKDTSLVVALSQSGETIEVISSVRDAKKKGAKIMAITNVAESTLYRLADLKMTLNAGPEKAVASTKAYTAKIAILYLLAYTLAGKQKAGIDHLTQAADEVVKLCTNAGRVKELADSIKDKEHIFIMGRGVSYPAALESALKIKEVSYIHAEGFAGGELKHGVIALIEKGTPVILYNPEDETYEDTLSSAHEVKARGAHIIGISSKPHEIYDEYIEVGNCNDATIIPHVVVAQLLGYYLAIGREKDPDKPRNLAKSVTVK